MTRLRPLNFRAVGQIQVNRHCPTAGRLNSKEAQRSRVGQRWAENQQRMKRHQLMAVGRNLEAVLSAGQDSRAGGPSREVRPN